ncbi:hypothetical protein [Methylobacterium nodulans]|uniref:Uncharacterized protein n=1 Tax=Methylobacterium nodulans (strain LMG 21967 / CNCM I-2342 / ORS 2060) TaxID=460265 RepID=B8IIQ3_METNO|nr:hypothetical protein [Methylobacterium nodulans]ACL58977.1 conserved hypothetical protein [Methylobacterium nodulans ORS 2060]ACL59930.1 conserved hypothetical protein [Methylobacterium nodulans ORS 2060]
MSDRNVDPEMARGSLIAIRSILTVILTDIGREQGETALRRLHIAADERVEAAIHRMSSEDRDRQDAEVIKQVSSDAEGFLDDTFGPAFDSLL